MLLRKIYYILKPLMTRRLQIWMRRKRIEMIMPRYKNIWPIYESAAPAPDDFPGWPDGKKAAVILTHDVDSQKGHRRSSRLMRFEQELGFKSAFYFVPERYEVSSNIRKIIEESGFEVGVHGLNHDGKLFVSQAEFQRRANKIRQYLSQWRATGFSAPGMHHNLEWIQQLNIEYDISTYDTDPFEPQGGGVGTIFPFLVKNADNDSSYVEIPYTLPQDFTLLVLMKKSIDIWKKKVDWIFKHGGVVHLRAHPDYMKFDQGKPGTEEYPVQQYAQLLKYISSKYAGQYWNPLPKQLARFWAENTNGNLFSDGRAPSEILCSTCRKMAEEKVCRQTGVTIKQAN
jgi:peptidoglycan/xylan/chitin deacetylase (PgdA/CDA1 family)